MKPYYDEGGVTLYHCDFREILPGISCVDCCVTSPPYNQLGSLTASGLWGRTHGGFGFLDNIRRNGYQDDMEETEYQEWQRSALGLVRDTLAVHGSVFYKP